MRIISIAIILAMVNLVNGQINTPCTTSMISSFTPCANYITGSTNNGAIPSNTCCDSLTSLISTSMDCACLIISANAPILPGNFINQALVLSLAKACNIGGVSAQCKASGSPLPAPGPAILGSNGPTIPPIANFPTSPQASNMQLAASTPTPTPVEEAEPPSNIPGIQPLLTPLSSASHPSYVSFSLFALLLFMGLVLSATY
ncbi:PREDICTED: protein YLS3-like isoform X2 [Lupinus angustifolius]|uniref:protein YLS3-like isoform X2 n=1 Tax=Lupinus angustifolius TaxID=3871 RepID=UPI00092FD988|nr:PREDICTED: protein YLS3-like isoform X2 [Lupinus angustifolius]